MKELVFFLEEQSAKELLLGLLPRLLGEDINFRCISFEGKHDLEKQLSKKLRGWLSPGVRFIVLRDQDGSDCYDVKKHLIKICHKAGKSDVLVRIVCHELESWFLGDLQAVETGLGVNGLSKQQNKRKYRDPDRLQNPKQELKRLTCNDYQQILGSREIGRHLSIQGNRSNSFNAFITGLQRLVEMEVT